MDDDFVDRIGRKLRFGSREDRRHISTDFNFEECAFLLAIFELVEDAGGDEISTVVENLRKTGEVGS